jgi:serine/threonine protein kinase
VIQFTSPHPGPGLDFLGPPQSADEMGRLGPYRVLEVLGRGGMGLVFRAEDTVLKRPVALKVIKPTSGDSNALVQRFLREARLAAAIKHDHIVTIYAVGEDRGIPFLAMELLEGESLEARLRRQRLLPPHEAARIACELAEALAAAHRRGLVHRDVKPANIWLEGDRGRVKLLDFGLARTEGDVHLTRSGAIFGTPAYMSPEQARGEKLDARSDLFSLGVVLYRTLTGKLPFTGPDPLSILAALATAVPPPPHVLEPATRAALSELVMRLLEKDRDRRPATADEVAKGLRHQDQPPTVALPRAREKSRSPWRLALLAGAAVVLALVVGRLLLLIGPPRQDEWTTAEPQQDQSVDRKKQAPRTMPPADREKPFVLRRAGGKSEEFKQLAEAVAVLGPADDIEVHGGGPFSVSSLTVRGKELSLRAAPGYRPRFVPLSAPAGTEAAPRIEIHEAALRLEGCDFVGFEGALFAGSGKSWQVRNCRFLGNTAVRYTGPGLHMESCFISIAVYSPAAIQLGPGSRLDLVNCFIRFNSTSAFSGLVGLDGGGGQKVRLRRNTLLNNFIGAFHTDASSTAAPIDVDAVGNCFSGTLFHTPKLMKLDESWKKTIRWTGRDNLYAPHDAMFIWIGAGQPWMSGLGNWNQFWGKPEEGSRQTGAFTFRCCAFARQPPEQVVRLCRQEVQRLRRGPAARLPALGPNFDRLGPGQVLPEGKRADAPADGPFVLVRRGKMVRGFLTLQQAWEGGGQGDVIECRTDGPTGGATLEWQGGNLDVTIRAAAGYRPMFTSALTVSGRRGRVVVEGAHFRNAPLVLRCGSAVVRGCSFHRDTAAPGVEYTAPAGEVGVLVLRDCIVPVGARVHRDKSKSLTVEVDNSVVGPISAVGGVEIRFRRSVSWAVPGITGHTANVDSETPPTVSAWNTLVEAPDWLYMGGGPVKWTGEGNVYRCGPLYLVWEKHGGASRLEEWPKRLAAGSLLLETPTHDPRQWAPLLPDEIKGFGADVNRIGVASAPK